MPGYRHVLTDREPPPAPTGSPHGALLCGSCLQARPLRPALLLAKLAGSLAPHCPPENHHNLLLDITAPSWQHRTMIGGSKKPIMIGRGRAPDGKIMALKCDLCPDREVPACAASCPTGAITYLEGDEFAHQSRVRASTVLAEAKVVRGATLVQAQEE